MSDSKTEFGSGFLYVENLINGGKYVEAKVTIASYVPENTEQAANKKLIDKPIIGFEGKAKRLVVNKTNAAVITVATGEQPGTGWIGKTITLQARIVQFGRDEVAAIRVLPPSGAVLRKSVMKRMGRKAEL